MALSFDGRSRDPEFRKAMLKFFGPRWPKLYRQETLSKMHQVFEYAMDSGKEIGKRMSAAKPDVVTDAGKKAGPKTRHYRKGEQ